MSDFVPTHTHMDGDGRLTVFVDKRDYDALEAELAQFREHGNLVYTRKIEALTKTNREIQAEVERLRAALEKIACFNDTAIHLDEPVSATIAREALK